MTQKQLTNQYKIELHEQILKLCHEIELPLHDFNRGCKLFTNYQRVALIILFRRSKKALRKFVTELIESKWPQWLGLKEIPGKSTLHDWCKRWDVKWLRKVLKMTVAKTKPFVMAIDATGFDSFQRSKHYEMRLKQFGVNDYKMPFAKVDLLIDTKNKLIYDFVLRTKPRHDTLGASSMVKRLKHKGVLILADKGYDSEPLHQLVANTGNLMYAPIRDFKVKKPKGKHRRRCSNGHKLYFQRNIVESINFSLKSRFRSLKSKLHWMKKREFAWQMITYNLEKLSQSVKALFNILKKLTFSDRAVSSNLAHNIA